MSAPLSVVGTSAALAESLDPNRIVTEECPDCGKLISGAASGKGSVKWKLGTHRRQVHGVKGAGRPRKGAPTADDYEAHPVVSSVIDAASAVGGKGTPNTEQLASGLGQGLHILTATFASVLVETDPVVPRDQKDFTAAYITMTDTACKQVMTPFARMLAPTKINTKYGRQVVDNVGVLAGIGELAMWGFHLKEYLEYRARGKAQLEAAKRAANEGIPMGGQPMNPAPVPTESVVQNGVVTTPPGTEGRVLSAEDVAAMRR